MKEIIQNVSKVFAIRDQTELWISLQCTNFWILVVLRKLEDLTRCVSVLKRESRFIDRVSHKSLYDLHIFNFKLFAVPGGTLEKLGETNIKQMLSSQDRS